MYMYVQSCCLRPCQVLENYALWTDVHHQIGWGHFQFFYVYFGTLQESSSCIQSMAQILVSWEGTPSRNILHKQRPYLWCGGNGELPQSRSSCLAVLLYCCTEREKENYGSFELALIWWGSVEVVCWRREAGRASARAAATLEMSWNPIFTGFRP